jgi:hypothetical protein
MITERAYETAKAKLAEYEARKDSTLKAMLLTFPSEMASSDKQEALGRVKDALSDAYYDLVITCNEIIAEYEKDDLFEHHRIELGKVREFYNA